MSSDSKNHCGFLVEEIKAHATVYELSMLMGNLVPSGCIPFGQHQGCKTSGIIDGIINVKKIYGTTDPYGS